MTTIVTRKIGLAGGPTRDYSSIQAWEDACPANLVTVDQVWKGEGYNDGELLATAVTTISGTTTDATRYLWLSAAPGHSFDDNPAKATNRLAYVAANGVALRVTAAYATVLDVLTPYTRVDSWQFQCSAANSYGVHLVSGANFAKIANCIVQSRDGPPLRLSTGSQTATNCLAIANSAVGRGLYLESAPGVYNCTVVRPSNFPASGDAAYSVYGAATVKNTAFFGFSTLTGTFAADGHNLTSMATAPGTTGNLVNKVYANQFVQTSTAGGAEDFRLKAGSDAIDAGVTDATVTTDIIGTARPAGAAYDIGAWEFAAAGPVTQTLVGAAASQVNTATTGAVVQTQTLVGAAASQANTATSGAIAQTHMLAGSAAMQTNAATTGVATETHILAGAPGAQPNVATAGAVGQTHILAGAPAAQANAATAGAVAQTHTLAGAPAAQANAATVGALVPTANDLTVVLGGLPGAQANAATVGAIVQTHTLAGAPASQANAAPAGAMRQTHTLAGANASQANAATAGALLAGDPVVVPAAHVWSIAAEPRTWSIAAENRTWSIC